MIQLKEVTKENYEEVISLGVSEGQRNYVSANVFSLAEAWAYRDTAYPFAIYEEDRIVGFVMLGFYEERQQYTLWKFMIGENFQRRGYGRKALRLAIAYLFDRFSVTEVFTGVSKGNLVAEMLYESIGFRKTGVEDETQLELWLEKKNFV